MNPRRWILKCLSVLPFIGISDAALSDTPFMDEGCRQQVIGYRAKCALLPGLWADAMDNVWPETDLIVAREGIDLLVDRPFILEGEAKWQAAWIARHQLVTFAEIEDGSFKDKFYPGLREIMKRYA